MKTDDKRILLENILRSLQSVLIGFSGGVDSTLLLQIGIEVLGRENILPVTIRSEVNTDEENRSCYQTGGIHGSRTPGSTISDLNCELLSAILPTAATTAEASLYRSLTAGSGKEPGSCY